jgi:hypothetical protein
VLEPDPLTAAARLPATRSRVVYLLSPANCGGKRASLLLSGGRSTVAVRLASGTAELGEVFTFMSGLYFRGKLAYARAFGRPPAGVESDLVIAPGRGLLPSATRLDTRDLQAMARIAVDLAERRYLEPFEAAITRLAAALGPRDRVVLLGSIATDKYATPLLAALGERVFFPEPFIGRGDMSRGGLMLRHVASGEPMRYVRLAATARHGPRPPKLPPLRRMERSPG